MHCLEQEVRAFKKLVDQGWTDAIKVISQRCDLYFGLLSEYLWKNVGLRIDHSCLVNT